MGSYPFPPHGLHFNILLILINDPLNRPCFIKHCLEYSEQVGVYLQVEGNNGEMKDWYTLIKIKNGYIKILFIRLTQMKSCFCHHLVVFQFLTTHLLFDLIV